MAKKDYTKWDRDDLIKEIEQLRKRKKYGLVWEDKPEDVMEQCKKELPVLEEDKSKEIIRYQDKPINLIIEGDNFHSLSVLNYTHTGKIDVIYIDPPYNTGAKDWKYNNDYVDENDKYRHSKWLSMMYKRLVLARKLLKRDGVLICTIDDYELHSITHLLADLGAKSLGRAVICIKPEGRRQSKYLMEAHEYALFVSWGSPKIRGLNADFGLDFPEKDEISSFRWEGVMRRDAGREDRGSDYWYPFYVSSDGTISTDQTEGSTEVWPINTKGIERVWLWDKNRAKENLTELKATIRKNGITIYYKRREQGRVKPTTFWFGSKYNANAYGTRLLKKILPTTNFLYPKSVYSVLDCIDLFLPENGLVLDYFAGSGTTAHAVLMLNETDNGSRRFIMSTNNENGIAEEVCYPRIVKVIEGYEDIKGIPSNLKYYKTSFVPADSTDKNKVALTNKATEMLCVKENTYEKVESSEKIKIFRNKKHYTGIIFDHLAIPEFKNTIKDIDGRFSVYVFSLGDDTFDEEFEDIKNKVKLSPIPEAILRVYRRIFK